jgi:hypothetical protein
MSHLHRQLAAQAAMAEIPAEKCAKTLCDQPSHHHADDAPKKTAKKVSRGKKAKK